MSLPLILLVLAAACIQTALFVPVRWERTIAVLATLAGVLAACAVVAWLHAGYLDRVIP